MARNIFTCIDAHTCGNPVRLITKGGPELRGDTMNEKRLHFMKEYDIIIEPIGRVNLKNAEDGDRILLGLNVAETIKRGEFQKKVWIKMKRAGWFKIEKNDTSVLTPDQIILVVRTSVSI